VLFSLAQVLLFHYEVYSTCLQFFLIGLWFGKTGLIFDHTHLLFFGILLWGQHWLVQFGVTGFIQHISHIYYRQLEVLITVQIFYH
jgi:hypothetical protein